MLTGHKELHVPFQDNYKLYLNKPNEFIADLYDMNTGENVKRGYNNNGDVYQPCALANIHTYFPETKLIIAIRHPVRFVRTLLYKQHFVLCYTELLSVCAAQTYRCVHWPTNNCAL